MIIGIDLGGTKITFGLVKNNKVIKKLKMQTEASKGKTHVINRLIQGIDLIKGGYNIQGIGIGSPGPLDYKTGIILNTPNLPFKNVPLKKIIKDKFKTKVEIDNDANCAAVAEKKYGKGKNLKNFVVITLGTGIGSGVYINNELYHGNLFAAELGHLIIDNNKEAEDIVSGSAIIKKAKQTFGKKATAKELVAMAKKGNKTAKKILDQAAKDLGILCTNIMHAFDPELIIINGGVKEAGSYLFNKAEKEMNKRTMFKGKIALSNLNDAGVLGATCLIK